MAGSSSAPALVATFIFGFVVLAASVATFFFVNANRSPLFRDELRLALVLFLATSALWGVLEFVTTLVSENVTLACQVVISFAAIFDQLARLSVEQFLLWGVSGGMKVSKLPLVLQGALFLRFIIGAVFVGVQRPQFEPVCVASNLVLPVGIILMVVDMAMIMVLSTKAVLSKNGNALRPELSRTNTLIFVAAGLGIWTALSTHLFLGLKSTALAVRTVLPAIGLLILIGIVALSAKNFMPPPSTSTLKIQKTVSFDSATHVELPTRNLDARAFPSQTGKIRAAGALPLISQPPSGQATQGIGGLPVEGELFPPMRAQTAPVRTHSKKQMSDRAFKGGEIVISKPIVQANTESSIFDNIPTIDLATAALKEKERRELRPPNTFSSADTMLGKALSPGEIMGKLQTPKRKQVPQSAVPNKSRSLLSVEESATATTSAVRLSPGVEEARRRSPRQPLQVNRSSPSPPVVPSKDEVRTPKSAPLQTVPIVLGHPPRSTKIPFSIEPLQTKSAKESITMPGVESESPSRKSVMHRPRPIPRKSTASASALLGISFGPSQEELMHLASPNLPLISPVSVKSLTRSSFGVTSSEMLSRHKTVRRTSFVPDLAAVPVGYQGQQPRVAQEDSQVLEAPLALDIPMSESSTSLHSDTQLTAKQLASWHHRVGEELPGFSSHLKYRRSRKLLVPRPLALYKPTNLTVVVEAEPSPIEPPQEALDRIHEQLKQFDLENGDARATISEQHRLTILTNLESEMGAQESQWQMLRVYLAPGSSSTIASSSGINSLRGSVDISKYEGMPITKLNASAGDLLVALNEDDNRRLSTSSDQFSKEEALESGDDRLNRRSLSTSGIMSILSVTNRTRSQISSPTPPDTDESAEDSDNDGMVEGLGLAKDLSTVLMPRSQASTVTGFSALDEVLNGSSEDVQSKLNAFVELEDVSLITPKDQSPPVNAQSEDPKAASATAVEAETIRFSLEDLEQPVPRPRPRPRPVTRRPPRQSKRISALPDIVENPEPLVGKSGTLGIFQFPWGEKSDSARIPPRMAGISGTMSSGRACMSPPAVPMNSIQERQADYTPATPLAFLDDDQVDNGLDNYEDEDYDDGFDEATLWEIASLLECDLVNSRDDLFIIDEENWEDRMPPAVEELPPASLRGEDVSESAKEEAYGYIPVALTSENSFDISFQAPTLWTANMKESRTTKLLCLPQPSEGAWKLYSTAASRPARAIPRVMREPAQLSSTSLWMIASIGASMDTAGLWCAPTAYRGEAKETKAVKAAVDVIGLVWSPPNPTKISGYGLPQPDTSVRSAYIPQETRTVRRTARMPQPTAIEITSLWTLNPAVKPTVSNGVWCSTNQTEAKMPTIALASLWSLLSLARGITLGLPQPETSVWNSYISPMTCTVRSTARMPLPTVIASASMWTLKSTVKPSVSEGVWCPASKESSLENQNKAKATNLATFTTAPSLWSPVSVVHGNSFGLPQPDIQAWRAYIFPENRVARRRAPRGQHQLAIESVLIWTSEPVRTIEMFSTKLWSLTMTTLLWAPSTPKHANIGLPQPDVKIWSTYNVLSAGSIRRKANVLKSNMITSTTLWLPSPVVAPQPGGARRAKSLHSKSQLAKASQEPHTEPSF
ncbi:hypothetical protein V8C37DRAFT_417478 [Trichoderma ceciliae]